MIIDGLIRHVRYSLFSQSTSKIYMTHNITWPKLTKYRGITKNVKFGYTTGMLSLQIPPTYASALPPLITMFMGPTWGSSGADRTQVGPMLAPWILLSGHAVGRGGGMCGILCERKPGLSTVMDVAWSRWGITYPLLYRDGMTLPDFRYHQRRFTVALSRVCKMVRWFSDVVVEPKKKFSCKRQC